MTIKAAFFDIDGTLISFKTHKVPQSTISALTKAKQYLYQQGDQLRLLIILTI